jgi:hypothetical protein
MSRDVAAELIALLRALPQHLAMQADHGPTADGLQIPIPEDPNWRLEILPTTSGWVLHEVWDPPGPMAGRRTPLGASSTTGIVEEIAREFSRLQLQRRNAACGTPTGPDGRRSRT